MARNIKLEILSQPFLDRTILNTLCVVIGYCCSFTIKYIDIICEFDWSFIVLCLICNSFISKSRMNCKFDGQYYVHVSSHHWNWVMLWCLISMFAWIVLISVSCFGTLQCLLPHLDEIIRGIRNGYDSVIFLLDGTSSKFDHWESMACWCYWVWWPVVLRRSYWFGSVSFEFLSCLSVLDQRRA